MGSFLRPMQDVGRRQEGNGTVGALLIAEGQTDAVAAFDSVLEKGLEAGRIDGVRV
ncbi:hypothetical protein MES4922_190410 [Mesorhizobium ventifaucium]|uniref:Uncharacterized protein n=1 Tax=Mesorhizobium ventifaucium TaxID=666020 RepID=A0ABN8JJR1_9HYPH|nr:hypothetical protein MES4922_190410 [Mesorhizobium ventifaucium]